MTDVGFEPAEHYDRVTQAWGLLLGEEFHYGVFDEGDEELPAATGRLTDLMIESAQLEPGLELIDVGCGTGGPACRLAKDFGVRVLGITTSPVGVEEATARAEAEGVSDLARFEVRDGADSGLPDGSFDRVWALESSHLIRDREGLIGEFARLLRSGGRLSLCDIVLHREIPFAEVRKRMADFVTLREAFGDAHMEPIARYEELARSAGLEVDETIDLTQRTLPTFERWRRNAGDHDEEVRGLLGDEGREAFVRGADILEGMWGDGTMGYALLAAHKPGG